MDYDFSPTVSRRKLILANKNYQSNLAKAVILYQSPDKCRTPGRNLVLNSPNPILKEQNKVLPNVAGTVEEATDRGEVSKGSQIIYCCAILGILLLTMALLSQTIKIDHLPTKFEVDDLNFLTAKLATSVFGQPLALNALNENLQQLLVTVQDFAVLLLYGPTGTGKTHTINLISRNLPPHVNQMKMHLPLSTTKEIEKFFKGVKCHHWNFLFFEDSDYADTEQIRTLANMLNEIHKNSTCPHMKMLALFTSLYGHKELTELKLAALNETDHQIIDQNVVSEAVKNVKSPLMNTLKQSTIPFVMVPYFPVSKQDIELCIKEDLRVKGKSVDSEIIAKVINNMRFFPVHWQYFAVSGCKHVSTQVNLHS